MTNYYFDYAATTPMDPLVIEKMIDCLKKDNYFGNPASLQHTYGKAAHQQIELARQQVADLLHTVPRNIIFTSGATEANNLAIKGVAGYYQKLGKHIITTAIEHPSVLECCDYLAEQGFDVTYLDPDKNGIIEVENLKTALRPDTILVSMMHVNNEIGIIQNIAEIARITKSNNVILHVDAVQSLGKIPLDLTTLPVDLMSFSAHKIYGPKGVGALYLGDKPRVKLQPQIHGGHQERKLRAGTLATHQIVGMGEACRIAQNNLTAENERIEKLRNQLWQGMKSISRVFLNVEERLLDQKQIVSGILNVRFEHYPQDAILKHLEPYAVSIASACNTISQEPSHVLRAMKISKEAAARSIRFSIGRFTTEFDINALLKKLQVFNS